ncbi:MAG: GDSL-type esterase/lipase family protein [Fuerstiella sp.]
MRSALLPLALSLLVSPGVAQTNSSPQRWEKNIQEFERRIADGDSKPGGVLFVGSSSIRLWKLDQSFPSLKPINHGFGGSEISDSLHYFNRIIAPLKPSMIVLYAGDNDIAKGKTAETVHADFRKFVQLVKSNLSADTRVGFIAIKPSIKRWNLAEEMASANKLIETTCAMDDQLVYIDIWKPMLGADGRPRPELFAKDGLHLNDTGYELWNSIVAKMLPPE